MLKIHYLSALAAIGLSAAMTAQAASCGGEVRFAKGASSASLSGKVAQYDVCAYTFYAKEGQALTISFAQGNRPQAFLYSPVSEALVDNQPFILPKSGKYELRVGLTRNDARKYSDAQGFTMDLSITSTPMSSSKADNAPAKDQTFLGGYEGLLPCASCSGVDTYLSLYADGSYTLNEQYQGQGADGSFTNQGYWTKAGAVITLVSSDNNEAPRYLYLKNDGLFFISEQDVNNIEASLNANYQLKRAQ